MDGLQDTLKKIGENIKDSAGKQNKDIRKCQFCGKDYDYFALYCELQIPLGSGSYIEKFCTKECAANDRKRWIKENIVSEMAKIGIPLKYQGIMTDRQKTLKEAVNSQQGLYAWGEAGTGKTVFVCSLARELLISLKKPYFISSPKLIMQLQDMYIKEGSSAFDYLDMIAKKEVLIIDDLGAEKITAFVKQALYYLINEREQWQRQTIITSNYNLSTLDEQIDGRISSRIAGMCNVIHFNGHDRRIKR